MVSSGGPPRPAVVACRRISTIVVSVVRTTGA